LKSWQKQIIQLGLPVLIDWVKSLFSEDKKEFDKEIKELKKQAMEALRKGNKEKFDKIMDSIKLLRS